MREQESDSLVLITQLGVDVETLRALRDSGTGPAYIVIGPRTVRYLGWDVGDWLDDSGPEGR